MRIRTLITEMLNIDLPIIGAPMFLVSYPGLVSAVSNAGGIGCFPALNYRTKEDLQAGLSEIRSLTDKPIGVNLIMHKMHNPKWPEQFEVCMKFKVELLITSLGTPRSIVQEAKAEGAKIFCDVTTLKHARIVAKAGADAIIAVAQGAGGHAGNISPFSLIPYIKKETNLPVIAAGAISTGRQMAAAFALGADAVYIGTRLIASTEASVSDEYKQMLIDSIPEEIVYTSEISGIPSNWLKKSIEKVQKHKSGVSLSDEKRQWKDIWSAGHGVSDIHEVVPTEQIMGGMIEEYMAVSRTLPAAE